RGEPADGVDITLRNEIVDRLDVAAADRLGNERRRLGLCLGLPLARLSRPESRLAPAFGGEDHRRLLSLCLEHRRLLEPVGLEYVGAPFAFGLHLPRHCRYEL